MTDNRLAAIADDLREERSRLDELISGLQTQLAAIQGERERTVKALSALGEKPARKNKAAKESVTKGEVADMVAAILNEHGPMMIEPLKDELSRRVSATGRSLQGLALARKAALKDNTRFVDTPGGYRLVSEEVSPVETRVAESAA